MSQCWLQRVWLTHRVSNREPFFWLLSNQKQAERRASEASLCWVKQMRWIHHQLHILSQPSTVTKGTLREKERTGRGKGKGGAKWSVGLRNKEKRLSGCHRQISEMFISEIEVAARLWSPSFLGPTIKPSKRTRHLQEEWDDKRLDETIKRFICFSGIGVIVRDPEKSNICFVCYTKRPKRTVLM